jgi:hypothetical protein
LLNPVAVDAKRVQLACGETEDEEGPPGPQSDALDVGARGLRRRGGMGVEDGELVPLVLQEPELRIDVELEAIR